MKTPHLPRTLTIDKVLKCIKEKFNKCELVTPWLIQERSKNWCGGSIDYREALAALESLAFDPGLPIAYDELQSCLTRSNKIRDLLLDKYPKEWWYDAEGCEMYPIFPFLHQIAARRFPIIHSFLQSHVAQ
jgi:hypothetical protein